MASTVHTGNSRYKVKRRMKDQNGRCKDVLVAIPNASTIIIVLWEV